MDKKEANTLVVFDGWRTFLIYKAFKDQGKELNFNGLIRTVLTALSHNSDKHYVNKLGFRAAFIGLPKTIEPELREFLNKLQDNDIIISSTALVGGREKEQDSRLQEFCTNLAKQVDKIILMSGDGDFAHFIRELKMNYNKDTILISTELPEHNLHLSRKLLQVCSDYIDLSKLTDNTSIFTPVKKDPSLQQTILQTTRAKTGEQSKTPLINLMQRQPLPQKKYFTVVKKIHVPDPTVETLTQAIKDSIAYKENHSGVKPSWISLESLKKTLSTKGLYINSGELYRLLRSHKDRFYVSTYQTRTELLTTVSIIQQQQFNYAV